MSILTTRAEQGLLGAILRDGARGDELPAAQVLLETGDFGHRAHQQVWTALVDLHSTDPGLAGQQLLNAVASRIDAPGADLAWLERLRDAGAQRRHLPSYIRMIQTAALRREIASTAERLTAHGENPRLADALTRQVRAHEAITADTPLDAVGYAGRETATLNGSGAAPRVGGQERAPEPQPQRTRTESGLPAVQQGTTIGGDASPSTTRAEREDLLLADLLRNPEQAGELARVFPAETLTDPQRREVFRSIVTLAADGDPVDAVIVAVNIEQQRAYAAYLTNPAEFAVTEPPIEPADPGTEPAPAYLSRLTQLGVETATEVMAVEIARDLISDDVRIRLAEHATGGTTQFARPPAPTVGTHPGTTRLRPEHDPVQAQPSPQPMPLQPPQHRPGLPQAPGPSPRIQP